MEVKIRLESPGAVLRRLRKAGFVLESRETEHDVVLDTAQLVLRNNSQLLRLRRHGGKWLVTFKGRPANDPLYKAREEIETPVADGRQLRLLFERLGFRPVFAYEKRRRIFRRRGEPGLVVLDHTPIGHYLELEGPRRWIDRTAKRLGFGPADYQSKSYGQLYQEYCRARGIEPTNMVFSKVRK